MTDQRTLGRSSGRVPKLPPQRDVDLDRFLRSLETAWKDGDVRPTHASKPKPDRHGRTRKDPFAEVWPMVILWLEQGPDQTATDLFARLRSEHPGRFKSGPVRTLQRRSTGWAKLGVEEGRGGGERDQLWGDHAKSCS